METFPDIILEFTPEWTGSEALSGRLFSAIPKNSQPAATHRRRGLLISSGPSFRKGWEGEYRLEDIVPTICAILNIPLPLGTDGQVLNQTLKRPLDGPGKTKSYPLPGGPDHQWNQEERRQVTAR